MLNKKIMGTHMTFCQRPTSKKESNNVDKQIKTGIRQFFTLFFMKKCIKWSLECDKTSITISIIWSPPTNKDTQTNRLKNLVL